MKRLLLALAAFLWLAPAEAQICPTAPAGTSNNQCASTQFVQAAIPLVGITALTGDVTATGPGSVPATLAPTQPGAHTWTLGQTFSSSMTYGGVTLANAVTGTGNMVLGTLPSIASPTITGHPTVEGVTSTGATGTGNFVFSISPTITGHPTIEGVTSTGATGTGKFVFDTSPTISGLTVTGSFTATGLVTNADLANPATTVNGQTCTLGSTCTVTAVPSGSAGGDLTGTYPNPTLAAKIVAGGPTGSATVAPIITYNAAGQLTTVSSATITPAVGSITGLGTGVATALGVNVGSAGAFVTFNGALGTPSSGTLTSATGLPISTGVSGLGTGVATALAVNTGSVGSFARTIATGATALNTAAIASTACNTTTAAASGVLTTDAITASFNGSTAAVTGYVPLTTGGLSIRPYPTADNVNFEVCNGTTSSITPGALTLNWGVRR